MNIASSLHVLMEMPRWLRLFAADAVDISSDIQVLETMIAKDGLTQQALKLKL